MKQSAIDSPLPRANTAELSVMTQSMIPPPIIPKAGQECSNWQVQMRDILKVVGDPR